MTWSSASTLTPEQAIEMRAAHARGERTVDLAARYGVSRQIVRLVLSNQTVPASMHGSRVTGRLGDGGCLSQSEIADRLGISRQLVAYYERRALAKMRAVLSEDWR